MKPFRILFQCSFHFLSKLIFIRKIIQSGENKKTQSTFFFFKILSTSSLSNIGMKRDKSSQYPDLAHVFIWGGGRVSGVVCSEGQGERPGPSGSWEGPAGGSSVRSEEGDLRGPEDPHLGMTCWEWMGPADTPLQGLPCPSRQAACLTGRTSPLQPSSDSYLIYDFGQVSSLL